MKNIWVQTGLQVLWGYHMACLLAPTKCLWKVTPGGGGYRVADIVSPKSVRIPLYKVTTHPTTEIVTTHTWFCLSSVRTSTRLGMDWDMENHVACVVLFCGVYIARAAQEFALHPLHAFVNSIRLLKWNQTVMDYMSRICISHRATAGSLTVCVCPQRSSSTRL